ncbi:hypothetical protein SKAU_G00417460 [Synaphobranchus kaupii]|uniref:Ig-like domain-containing protein n=1 Tax=Synaphobranchus kaupii TaxID=118154 RepID=A0A9Q1IA17_SYNKA|nr:hypothetical protein SKAU_G00417460 [Synaphobranchus kaupii]
MGVRDTLHCWGLTLLILPGVLVDSWGVSYPEKQICAVRGSTVIITCQYTYPDINMKIILSSDTNLHESAKELMVTSSRTTEPIKEGDNVILTCATKNSCNVSQSELTWLKDKMLFPGPPTRLEFKFISHQNTGTYSCALKNNITISSNEIIVAVQPKRSVQFLIALLVGIVLTMLAVALVANIYFKRSAKRQEQLASSTAH